MEVYELDLRICLQTWYPAKVTYRPVSCELELGDFDRGTAVICWSWEDLFCAVEKEMEENVVIKLSTIIFLALY